MLLNRDTIGRGIPWLRGGFWRWCSSALSPVCCWQAFHEEYSRLYLLAKETPTPRNDTRLQHVLIYLLQNNAPQQVVERTLLEQFADKNLSYDERCVPQVCPHPEAAQAVES